jgi:competence protein ComEC
VPVVAWAFAAYASGLLTGFVANGAAAYAACFIVGVTLVVALLSRSPVVLTVAVLFLSGQAVASVAPPPPPAWEASPGSLESVRSVLGRRIDRIFGADAQIARALLIADQRQMPLEIRDRYATAGLVHMLSISGLHVSIIASALELLLLALRFRRRLAVCLSVALVFGYVAVLDWRAPAFRAAVMYGTISLSRGLQRPVSPWAALSLGGWLPLISPRTVLELGYQLSLCGMAALTAAGIVGRRLRLEELGSIRGRIVRDLLASTFASVTTAPLVAWYFGRVSLIGPVSNLFAGPVIAILQPTLFLALALSPVTALSAFVGNAAHPLFVGFDRVASTAAALPFAGLDIAPTLAVAVASGCAALALIVAAAGRRPGRPLLFGCMAIAATVWQPVFPRPLRDVELHVLDVGQGDAVAVRTDGGNWVLFDAGRAWKKGDAGRTVVIPYVRRRGGDVLGLVLSHPHADHVGGAASLLRWLRPPRLWDPAYAGPTQTYRDALSMAVARKTEWKRVVPGESMLADGVRITFLAPDSAWTAALDDPNEASAVALVQYGETRMLLTGDAERNEEEWLLRNASALLDVDVLKIAHHGSRSSSSAGFLDAVTPRLALISVGAENAYRHPSVEVLQRLHERGVPVLRTDRHGVIVVRTNGVDIRVRHGGGDWLLLPR